MNENEQIVWGQPVSFQDFIQKFQPNQKILNPVFTSFFNKTPMQAAMRQIQSAEAQAAYWNATHPQTTNETPIVAQPDGTFRRETRNIPLNTSAEAAKTALEFTPVVGDVLYAGDVLDETRQGNYGTAAALAGLALLPNVVEKPLKKGLKKIGLFDNATTAAKATPVEWTAAQDDAIARGDMTEAQRLRDLHFKTYAPNTQIVDKNGNPIHSYHGTGKHFNEFDTTGKYSTLDEGYYGKGAYFAPNKEIAQMYADTEKTPIIYDTYLNIKNPLRHVRDENAALYGKVITDNDGVISKLPDDLVDETFDMTEYVATKPNQIKLADAVTYDDNGIRIPLGERDNFNINDIRYIWPTALLGGTAAASYANQQGLGRKQSANKFYSGGNIIKRFKSRNK